MGFKWDSVQGNMQEMNAYGRNSINVSLHSPRFSICES